MGAERSEGGGGEVDRLREVRCPWKIGNGLPGPDIPLPSPRSAREGGEVRIFFILHSFREKDFITHHGECVRMSAIIGILRNMNSLKESNLLLLKFFS